ncbi:paeninodin family lasso peptide [Sutcliffiella horikoshii]|nr:paeninodin family lasso peptide [Sutcliffiella horikoshii]UAL46926.1 paeninodin family lasso peptide [Sutcliffiella horikoshii]
MKKNWSIPLLEVLDVKSTMLQGDGDFTDNDFPQDTPKSELTFS